MKSHYQPPPRGWLKKFADAATGVVAGMRCQASFCVHIPAAIAVVVLAVVLQVSWLEGCLLALCITAVLGAELMNSALERLARAITDEYHEDVRVGLNIASGAVFVVAVGAAIVGSIILLPHLLAAWNARA